MAGKMNYDFQLKMQVGVKYMSQWFCAPAAATNQAPLAWAKDFSGGEKRSRSRVVEAQQ